MSQLFISVHHFLWYSPSYNFTVSPWSPKLSKISPIPQLEARSLSPRQQLAVWIDLRAASGKQLDFVKSEKHIEWKRLSHFNFRKEITRLSELKKRLSGWWLQSLWKIWKSIGMMSFPIYGKIIHSCSKPATSSWNSSSLLKKWRILADHPVVMTPWEP